LVIRANVSENKELKKTNYFTIFFGRIKRVITFAAPKEGNGLQRRDEIRVAGIVNHKK